MGICLDTDQSEGSKMFGEGTDSWAEGTDTHDNRYLTTPPTGVFAMQNEKNIHFEMPEVPVIFVLGGPGSGKVTHCDNIMQEKIGVIHINMTDLLQQYAIGNDMPDFGMLSSKTVTEVLMLEINMSPNSKTYLISGYPRNMRDVAEYSEKIGKVNGVILISWRQKVLERQIDYGAKLGQVVLSLAKMELNNFYKNVIPVADYFDQNNLLISVNGERPPVEVYKDFRLAVLQILNSAKNSSLTQNGQIENSSSKIRKTENKVAESLHKNVTKEQPNNSTTRPKTQILSFNPNQNLDNISSNKQKYPPVLWVVGGPGSNKAYLCATASKEFGWTHISLGKLLRAAADSLSTKQTAELQMLKEYISNGDMVPLNIVMKFVESNMSNNRNALGIILDGFPRDINQATYFESKFKQKPTIILLDCSKLQLGRGRLDDSVTAFRKRLEIFRHASLPMLKTMDNIGRLIIIDGDTDTKPVQEEFKNVVKDLIAYIDHQNRNTDSNFTISTAKDNSHLPDFKENGLQPYYSNRNNLNGEKDISTSVIKLPVNNILSVNEKDYKNNKYINGYSEENKITEQFFMNNVRS